VARPRVEQSSVATTSVTNERRIGRRWPSSGLAVGWDLQRAGGIRRHRVRARDGVVLDVSVSGAAILAPIDDDLVAGRLLAVGHGRHIGHVLIRRVQRSDRRDHAIYGVQFIDAPAGLVETLIELAAADPAPRAPHPYEGLWSLAC
jgi:hypothetical protein